MTRRNQKFDYVPSYEITALFTCLYGEGKSAAISKLANFLVLSCFYIVLALNARPLKLSMDINKANLR